MSAFMAPSPKERLRAYFANKAPEPVAAAAE
jgi:hypothetical protein